jgi:hypothetical protein
MKRLTVLMLIAVLSAATAGCCRSRPLLWRFRCCPQQSACDSGMPIYDGNYVPLVPAPGGSAPMTVVPGG